MALKEIAVQGCTLTLTGGGPGTANITSSPSSKSKAGGNGVYKKQIDISIAGCANGTCVQGAVVNSSIIPTVTKTKSDGDLVMVKNDKVEKVVINGTDSGTGAACSFTVDVEITSAGQTKAKAQ
jgi:hypothetical protein